ncbi:MAG: aminopeptidase [Bacteroidetes bacterium]|nr:MAG: aminopeptidase [Bacteroidota bacterium]
MRKRFRFIRMFFTDLLLVLLVAGGMLYLELLVYGVQQLRGQMNIVWNARPLDEVIKDASVPDSLKKKLELVKEIRAYAFDSIDLVRNENYTSFFDLAGQPPIYVVTACRPAAMEPYRWHFPVLGAVPYKGFFRKELAVREARRLRAQGYDVQLGSAGGWSTLGYFNDPVLSNMLNYDEGDLSELIIHELTHGTLFVKDSIDFNENLASFVGYKGALQFMRSKFGADSREMKTYLQNRSDESVVEKFMLRSAYRLDSLFKAAEKNKTPEQTVLREKYRLYVQILQEAKTLPLGRTGFSERLERRLRKAGNAVFMSYVRYGSKQDDFEKEFSEKYKGDLRKYVAELRKKWPSL